MVDINKYCENPENYTHLDYAVRVHKDEICKQLIEEQELQDKIIEETTTQIIKMAALGGGVTIGTGLGIIGSLKDIKSFNKIAAVIMALVMIDAIIEYPEHIGTMVMGILFWSSSSLISIIPEAVRKNLIKKLTTQSTKLINWLTKVSNIKGGKQIAVWVSSKLATIGLKISSAAVKTISALGKAASKAGIVLAIIDVLTLLIDMIFSATGVTPYGQEMTANDLADIERQMEDSWNENLLYMIVGEDQNGMKILNKEVPFEVDAMIIWEEMETEYKRIHGLDEDDIEIKLMKYTNEYLDSLQRNSLGNKIDPKIFEDTIEINQDIISSFTDKAALRLSNKNVYVAYWLRKYWIFLVIFLILILIFILLLR